MKKKVCFSVLLLLSVALWLFSCLDRAHGEEVIFSSSLDGNQYFRDENDNGERISGDARVTIRGNSVGLFSAKGAENASSVRYYLTVRRDVKAIRIFVDGFGSCYVVIVDQKKTTGLSEDEAINGPMLPFDGSGSRTLLLRDFPDILIDDGEYYMLEVHIIVANGNKYDLYNIAVDSLVGDDIVVPPRIYRAAPIQRSILYVLYNGPIIYSDGGYYDDWCIRGGAFWEWRRVYYRDVFAPCYPVFVRNYYPERTTAYMDIVEKHIYNNIFIVSNRDQLRKRNFDRRVPENRYRDMDSNIRRQPKTENRSDSQIQNNKRNSERAMASKEQAREGGQRNSGRNANGYKLDGRVANNDPIYKVPIDTNPAKKRMRTPAERTDTSSKSNRVERFVGSLFKVRSPANDSTGDSRGLNMAVDYSQKRMPPRDNTSSLRSGEVKTSMPTPPAEEQTQVKEQPKEETRIESSRKSKSDYLTNNNRPKPDDVNRKNGTNRNSKPR